MRPVGGDSVILLLVLPGICDKKKRIIEKKLEMRIPKISMKGRHENLKYKQICWKNHKNSSRISRWKLYKNYYSFCMSPCLFDLMGVHFDKQSINFSIDIHSCNI